MGDIIKVAWVSRHPPLPKQLEVLREKLGKVEVIQVSKVFKDAEGVYEEVKRSGATHAVVVLPLSMIARLVSHKDITWLWAQMDALHMCKGPGECPEFDETRDVWLPMRGSDEGRHMRFNSFKRIVRVELVLEDW